MAKLTNCQFIKINMNGKDLTGSCEEKNYLKWMEGYSERGLSSYNQHDGPAFDSNLIKIQMTQESSSLYENYLQRGYKKINITVVHRESNEFAGEYESQRVVYEDCVIHALNIRHAEDYSMFMDLSFHCKGSVEATFNVANAEDTGMSKVGPVKFDLAKHKIA